MKQDAANVHNFWYQEGELIRPLFPIVGFAAAGVVFHRTGHLRRDGQPTTHPTRGGGARASHLTPGYQTATPDGVSPQSSSNGIPCRGCQHTSHLP